ncbi:MAG: hypothetical protein NTW11_02990 [Candidatus Staskawiczbacteria bacterium]|nr:hypothetical protein [Candidatus Staskawiczbacteria bacterium]
MKTGKKIKYILCLIIATLAAIIVGLLFAFSKNYKEWSIFFFCASFFGVSWILTSIVDYKDRKNGSPSR